jgi:hypothetical protein
MREHEKRSEFNRAGLRHPNYSGQLWGQHAPRTTYEIQQINRLKAVFGSRRPNKNATLAVAFLFGERGLDENLRVRQPDVQ